MRKFTLGQLLQYYDRENRPVDSIQIVTKGRDWDSADEFLVDSALLVPFAGCTVTDLSCEESHGEKPIIRVGIDYS